MVDLSKIKASERTVEILHPGTGEKLGVRVPLVSIDDDRMKAVKRSITDRRLHLEQRGKHFKAEEIEENRNNLLFKAMTGWEWYNPTGNEGDEGYDADAMPDFGGEVPEFNRRNVVAVFEAMSWFRDQLDEAIGDEKAFFDNSKPN